MTVDYFHLSPVILSDDIFFEYNPTLLTTGTASQRESAYIQSEQQMMQHLRTFLTPTTVTGTYLWPRTPTNIRLDHGYMISVDRIKVTSFEGECDCDVIENSACAIIREGWGLIDARVTSHAVRASCAGCGYGPYYQAIVTYTAGLPTGIAANDKGLHHALAKISKINLVEMIDPGGNEGGPGDPGVEQWSSLGYSERRRKLKEYPFGASPEANYAARLVKHLKKIRALRL